MWSKDQLDYLIEKRKHDNENYHQLNNQMRYNFWRNIASDINIKFGTTYSGKQCKEKFYGLVRAYKKMQKYVDGDPKGKKTILGEMFFEVFQEHFWEKPKTNYDIVHEINQRSRATSQATTPINHSLSSSPPPPLQSRTTSRATSRATTPLNYSPPSSPPPPPYSLPNIINLTSPPSPPPPSSPPNIINID